MNKKVIERTMNKETIKISGESEGDASVGIWEGHFEIDTGMTELDENDREYLVEGMIRDMWELHDNGKVHFRFSNEKYDRVMDYKFSEEILKRRKK